MPKVVATIEARMASSRLPGKVLKPVQGLPALSRLLNRLRLAKRLDEIVLATSIDSSNDILEQWAKSADVACFRGSEEDVLARVVEAHKRVRSDVIVEICGDCVLIDPEIVDMSIVTFLKNDCDVVCTTGYPLGFGVQVFRLKDLEEVAVKILDPAVREHVSLYFYENPEIYRCMHLYPPDRFFAPGRRFQLDYQEDLDFINAIYSRMEPHFGDAFGIAEIFDTLRKEPSLYDINAHCVEKNAR